MGFNSRPCVRGDRVVSLSYKACVVFQFTPLREGRLVYVFRAFFNSVFQFTPLREGRRS